MKHKTALITSIILTGGILAAIASSIAWFDHKTTLTPAILQGSTQGAYFGGGNGTKDTPYLIKNQRHLYNLAWLQYLGEFNQTEKNSTAIDKQYYFKRDDSLKDSGLDRKDFVLPPIGTESNPFLGNFDGNDVTINNLTVSNNFNDLNKHPYNVTSDSFNKEDIQIVGFFGIVGEHNKLNYSYSSTINSVSNLYLNNVTISTSSSNTLCGIFAGYVNGPISYCGVHYATIKIGSNITKIDAFNNVSSYTLIGDYNQDGYEWEDKPGGDVGYGTSTDFGQIFNDLGGSTGGVEIKDGLAIKKDTAIPFKKAVGSSRQAPNESQSNITIYDTTQKKEKKATVPHASYFEASDKGNNIGYFVGSDIKVYNNKVQDDYVYNANDISIQDDSVDKTIDSSVLDYLNSKSSYELKNGQYLRRLSGNSSDSSILESALTKGDGYDIIENASVGKWNSSNSTNGYLLLPKRCVWITPIRTGKFIILAANPDEGDFVFLAIYKLKRQVPGDYSTYYTEISPIASIRFKRTVKYRYFAVDVTDLDYEYAIVGVSGGPYIAYLDIGANGGGSTTDKGSISKLDFVTADANEKLTKLTDPGYTESNSLFSINGTSSSEYVYSFRRINDSILYYVSPIGSGFTITEIGTGTKKKTDNADCKS